MNYYDYRSYFQDLIDNTDLIYSELTQLHSDVNARFDAMQTTLENGFHLIAALIVLSTVVKVMFR